jgi:hypothetical protein
VAVNTVERWWVAGIAAVASLALHSLILAPVLMGRPAHRTRQAHVQAGGGTGTPLTAVILNAPAPMPSPAASFEPDAAITQVPIEWPADLVTDQVEPATSDPASDPSDTTPDAAQGTADRSGTYVQRMSQITSRIQGAWTLPPTRLATDFHCRIRIRQDAGGSVSEVEFEHCDADGMLRASLLKAIDHLGSMPTLAEDSVGRQGGVTLDVTAFAAPSSGRRTSVEPGTSIP